ncbi:NADH-quinone oxidoreductase subunit B family protein [Candidatus Woesearchaeota archaeon]|nr:NADH-quinone oxidoreductase subunit B family protein [Candidatus Woesearchaeota archaeon]
MFKAIANIIRPKITEDIVSKEEKFERTGKELKKEIAAVFGRSLFIRELDSGSDNAAEIELVNLTTPYYDVERFGVSFVASPRHADVIIITGAITLNMSTAVRKVYEATPSPKLVVAVGDDACTGGVFKDSYAVLGGADKIIPVDLKIPGNPPTPHAILQGLLTLMKSIKEKKKKRS